MQNLREYHSKLSKRTKEEILYDKIKKCMEDGIDSYRYGFMYENKEFVFGNSNPNPKYVYKNYEIVSSHYHEIIDFISSHELNWKLDINYNVKSNSIILNGNASFVIYW